MKISIDDREHELITICLKLKIPIAVRRLTIGDVVLGRACVERKEAGDFVASISDGRLVQQIKNMVETYEKNCIVIHGDITKVKTDMHIQSILGMLASITARTNVNVVFIADLENTATFIYKFLYKANEEKPFAQPIPKRQRITNLQAEILMLAEGVGFSTAERILAKMGSIKAVFKASPEELIKVEGVGKKTAERIDKIAQLFI